MTERVDTAARRLVDLKAQRDKTKREAEKAERAYREAEADFWLLLEDTSTPSISLDLGPGYGRVNLQRRETVRGRVLDAEEAAASLEAAGLGDAVLASHRAVRQKVLNELVRSRLEQGQPLPEGVDFSTTRYITVSRRG